MSEWKLKRFWTSVRTARADAGWEIRLDDRPVRTPAKAALAVPTSFLADIIAAEWEAQEGAVQPARMPFTRMANSAIDKVAPQFDAVAGLVAEYGGSDLLCYRADGPEALIDRQAQGWDPLLDWMADQSMPLRVQAGIMPVDQPGETLREIAARTAALSVFELAAFHDLVALSGSWVLGWATLTGRLTPETAWRLSRIDEDYQIEKWGEDEEAAEVEAIKRGSFADAARFAALSKAD